jgi:exodeoxyribonuclease-1
MARSANQTLYWYDYETYGRNPHVDRIAQFAGLRTDLNLNVVGAPFTCYCKLSDDYLPEPEACFVHGLPPQEVNDKGVCEARFAAEIQARLGKPNTCAVGYNSVEFDDEFTRTLLYRNLRDPYAREWKYGCSRWDLMNVVRLTAALRPEGIIWPTKENGKPSFKLESLAEANDLNFGLAHDALNDVRTTIAVAQLIRQKQGRLYNYCFTHRGKGWGKEQLDLIAKRPVLHVDSSYGSEHNYLAVVVPIARHPQKDNGIIVYDLSHDPDPLINLSEDQIEERVFSKKEELEEKGLERIRLKTITLNRCPVLAEFAALRDVDAERLGIDKNKCLEHLETIKQTKRLGTKLRKVFTRKHKDPPNGDPDLMLYRGEFLGQEDRRSLEDLHKMNSEELAKADPFFSDPRLPEMLFRYRARNFKKTLTVEEKQRWQVFKRERLINPSDDYVSLAKYKEKIASLRAEDRPLAQMEMLNKLEAYADHLGDSCRGGL